MLPKEGGDGGRRLIRPFWKIPGTPEERRPWPTETLEALFCLQRLRYVGGTMPWDSAQGGRGCEVTLRTHTEQPGPSQQLGHLSQADVAK